MSAAPWAGLDGAGRLSPAGAGVLTGDYGPYLGMPAPGTIWPAGQAAAGQGRAGSDSGAGAGLGARDAAGGMILSEERLRPGTERVVTGRARLVRYVVIEEVTLTVSVTRKGPDRAGSGTRRRGPAGDRRGRPAGTGCGRRS